MPKSAIPFRSIAPELMRSIAKGNVHTPSLYYSDNALARESFWLRLRLINRQMNRLGVLGGRCMDFGGGGGVLLPTLAGRFDQVVCVDLDAREAGEIVQHFGLSNVRVEQTDIVTADYSGEPFDVIVAADVLEHFRDLAAPVAALHRWIKPDGLLFTSLPTENWVYALLRRLFGLEKPEDHYHTAYAVERVLADSGFTPLRKTYLPLPIAPLFLITAWRAMPG